MAPLVRRKARRDGRDWAALRLVPGTTGTMPPTAHVKAISLQAKYGPSAGTNSRHQVGRELPLRVAVAFCGNCDTTVRPA